MANSLQFTINVRKPHQPQSTLKLIGEDRMLLIWIDLHVPLCGQLHPKRHQAIHLVYPPSFCKLRSSSNTTNKNLMELGQEI